MSLDQADVPATEQKPKESFAEQFYRYFGRESASLEELISTLKDTPAHERKDALDHCAAGIARLAKEVKEAASGTSLGVGSRLGGGKIPPRDQKTYNDVVAALMDKLKKVRVSMASSSSSSFGNGLRFAIKSGHPVNKQAEDTRADTKKEANAEDEAVITLNRDLRDQASDSVQTVDFSGCNSVAITNHSNLQVRTSALPSLERYSVSLTDISSSFVDISLASNPRPTNLVIKEISNSILLLGNVNGPAHITNLKNTIIVLAPKQFRMHDCHNVHVYLYCGSKPVVENVKEVEFAPLPSEMSDESPESLGTNKWDKVQDFKWIKAGPSPNWKIMQEEHKLKEDVWTSLKEGKVPASEILRAASLE
jgi:hypothetical protein